MTDWESGQLPLAVASATGLQAFFLLFLTSPPETGGINIRETKVQNATVATLTSSCPSPSAALNTAIVVGHAQGREDSSAREAAGQAVTACHAVAGSFLVADNAGIMWPTRLAGTLLPAMAFLSCLRPESWDPCVQVCVWGSIHLLGALSCFFRKE